MNCYAEAMHLGAWISDECVFLPDCIDDTWRISGDDFNCIVPTFSLPNGCNAPVGPTAHYWHIETSSTGSPATQFDFNFQDEVPEDVGQRTASQTPEIASAACQQSNYNVNPKSPRRQDLYGRNLPLHPTEQDSVACGIPCVEGGWTCSFPDCRSILRFTRPCDVRKHYKRHFRSWGCRFSQGASGCAVAFATRKDRDRHESKHRPSIPCDISECSRVFSRMDNMVSSPFAFKKVRD
jgi:hypothetical protein